jgi:phage repressor protein C with HTH and peptisase S24 domain
MVIIANNLKQLRKIKGMSQYELAQKSGIPQQTISRYEKTGNISKIDALERLAKALHCLTSDIDPRQLDWDDTIKTDKSSTMSNAQPADLSIFKQVPLISYAAAKSNGGHMQATVDSLGDSDEYVSFPAAKDTDKAIQICGDSMSPWYPDGTYVLISTTQMPLTGDRVVVITEEGDILFKVFVDEKENVRLMSINRNNGQDIVISKRSEAKFYPIKMSLRDEQKLDDEMKEAGIKHFWEK